MSTFKLKIITCLTGVSGGALLLGGIVNVFLHAYVWNLDFTVLITSVLIVGVSGIIAGCLVFKWAGTSAAAFFAITALTFFVIPGAGFTWGPFVLFLVGALLSWVVYRRARRALLEAS